MTHIHTHTINQSINNNLYTSTQTMICLPYTFNSIIKANITMFNLSQAYIFSLVLNRDSSVLNLLELNIIIIIIWNIRLCTRPCTSYSILRCMCRLSRFTLLTTEIIATKTCSKHIGIPISLILLLILLLLLLLLLLVSDGSRFKGAFQDFAKCI